MWEKLATSINTVVFDSISCVILKMNRQETENKWKLFFFLLETFTCIQ